MDLATFRSGVERWIDDHLDELTPPPIEAGADAVAAHVAHLATVKRLAHEAGWARWGWPERVGGLGGSSLLRACLGEMLAYRGLVDPGAWSMTEVLVPTMVAFAPVDLAAAMVPRLLSGQEQWCQGFSEPGTGSNLASLSCRAVRGPQGWVVDGQKVWTSYAQYSARCVLLTRTGPPGSAHKGITALFVDMDSPGISVRPLTTQHGRAEFSEVFFDGVVVPFDRTLGEPDQGWAVAMHLLPYERSTSLWNRTAYLHRRLERLVAEAAAGAIDPGDLGAAVLAWQRFRARSRATQRRMAAGEPLGPETSVDKVLAATAEQTVFDLVGAALTDTVLLGDDPVAEQWREELLYSRAATIYGGTAEIQRNVIARRLLELGDDR